MNNDILTNNSFKQANTNNISNNNLFDNKNNMNLEINKATNNKNITDNPFQLNTNSNLNLFQDKNILTSTHSLNNNVN